MFVLRHVTDKLAVKVGGLDFMGNINRIWSVYTCIDMTSVLGVCGRALNAPLRQYGSYIYSSWE